MLIARESLRKERKAFFTFIRNGAKQTMAKRQLVGPTAVVRELVNYFAMGSAKSP